MVGGEGRGYRTLGGGSRGWPERRGRWVVRNTQRKACHSSWQGARITPSHRQPHANDRGWSTAGGGGGGM